MKKISIGVAQMTCLDGRVQENLSHASELAQEAASKGSEIIIFPEFMSQGYRLSTELWDSGEPFDGPTTRWLCAEARRLNVHIGSSFLEACRGHFMNTFAMSDPGGTVVGVVRKRYPSMWETYFFKGMSGEHTFNTDFGRVGVGICFDNHTHAVASVIADGSPDIVVMPHSYCTPTVPGKMVSQADIDRLNSLPGKVAHLYNDFLGVPVAMCNKSGPWNSPVPDDMLGTPRNFTFSGRSTTLDADGTPVVALDDREGVGSGEVTLNAELKKRTPIPKHGRYIYPGSFGREFLRIMELRGTLSYLLSRTRREKAFIRGGKKP